MSTREFRCSTCGAFGPAAEARNVPTWRAASEAYADAYYCAPHAAAAVEATRAHVAALDLEHPERDDVMSLLTLVALLRARGQQAESLAEGEAAGEGMERVRQQTLALLGRLPAVRLPIAEPSALCSSCFKALPASQVTVIPWHNEDVGGFVTTFRCGACVAESLADTRARVEAGDARVLDGLGEFLQRHAVTVLEWRRGDPPEVVRPLMLGAIERIRDGSIVLPIGETVPLEEALRRPAPPPATPPAAPPSAPPSAPKPSDGGGAIAPQGLWAKLRRLLGG